MHKRINRNALRDWEDVRYFLGAARARSFNQAGKTMGVPQSTISRRIDHLEAHLGAKLFDRHNKGMRLTPAGHGLLEQAERMEEAAFSIDRRLGGIDGTMRGLLRVAVTEGLAAWWLTENLVEFQRHFPGITIETVCGNEIANLATREADIAIRLSRPDDPRLVALRVGTMRFLICAARDYLDLYGTPKRREEIFRHRVIDHSGYHRAGLKEWSQLVEAHDAVMYRTNSSIAYFEALRAGLGIGICPTYVPRFDPKLVVLPIPLDCQYEIWLVTHEETKSNARLKAFHDHLVSLFERDRRKWFA
jgi:DNA-binding transcriptional LysR family regulator